MKKIETIEDVAQKLGDGGPFGPDQEFKTIGEIVDALVDLGNDDRVFAFHDDHLGLKGSLPDDFLKATLEEANDPKFESALEEVMDQANTIINLSERELSDDDIEEIREDKMSRGEDTDD